MANQSFLLGLTAILALLVSCGKEEPTAKDLQPTEKEKDSRIVLEGSPAKPKEQPSKATSGPKKVPPSRPKPPTPKPEAKKQPPKEVRVKEVSRTWAFSNAADSVVGTNPPPTSLVRTVTFLQGRGDRPTPKKTDRQYDPRYGLPVDLPDKHTTLKRAALSQDGKFLALAGTSRKLFVYSVGKYDAPFARFSTWDNSLVDSFEFPNVDQTTWFPEVVAFSPDSSLLAFDDMGTVRFFDMKSRKLTNIRLRHKGSVKSLEFHPRDKKLITASLDGTVRVWDCVSGKEIRKLLEKGRKVKSVSLSGDGSTVCAVVGGEGLLWYSLDATSAVRFSPTQEGGLSVIGDAALNHAGTQVAVGYEVGLPWIQIWNAKTRKLISNLEHKKEGDNGGHIFLRFLSTGSGLVSGDGSYRVRLWDASSAKHLYRPLLFHHRERVTGVSASKDGSLILSSGLDGQAILWTATREK